MDTKWVYVIGFIAVLALVLGVVSNKIKFNSDWFDFSTDNTSRDNKAKAKGERNKISQGATGQSSKNRAKVDGDDNEITQH